MKTMRAERASRYIVFSRTYEIHIYISTCYRLTSEVWYLFFCIHYYNIIHVIVQKSIFQKTLLMKFFKLIQEQQKRNKRTKTIKTIYNLIESQIAYVCSLPYYLTTFSMGNNFCRCRKQINYSWIAFAKKRSVDFFCFH